MVYGVNLKITYTTTEKVYKNLKLIINKEQLKANNKTSANLGKFAFFGGALRNMCHLK